MKTNFEYTGGAYSFVVGYIQCALWSSEGDNQEPLDYNYTRDDIEEGTLSGMIADCDAFMQAAGTMLDSWGAAEAGHCFWLTRNGHGSGFWDCKTLPYDLELTTLCRKFTAVDLHVGDDGKVYS